jgi:NitT/TauT family transport system substrate-binding protein
MNSVRGSEIVEEEMRAIHWGHLLPSRSSVVRILAPIVAAFTIATVSSAEPIKVVVSQRGGWDASVVELGTRAGIFKEQGLEVEILFASGGGEPIQALVSNSVDISVSTGFLATLGAISKGAPLEIVSSAFTGTSDSFWYVPSESPIKSLADTPGKTVAFTGYGSSSQMVLLRLLEQNNVSNAKTVAGGNPTAIQTAVMSGQIDVGFSIAPMGFLAADEGKIRIIARGGDVIAMKDQTTRVNVVSTRAMTEKAETIRRFMLALNKSLDFMYGDERALQWFGEMHKLNVDQTRRSRDTYHPRAAMQTGAPRNIELTLSHAKQYKYVPPDFSAETIAARTHLISGQ